MGALAPLPRRSWPAGAPRRLLRLRSDAALGERFASGDEAAFAVLYERHRASVLAVCLGVTGSRQDAEDATQEAFTSLALTLRRGVPERLRPWLVRVARNAAIDLTRRAAARPVTDDLPADAAVREAGGRDELAAVLDGIRQLPESQRTALLMRELAGLSYEEIGTLMDQRIEAVRGLIARARTGLRAHREAQEMACGQVRDHLAAEPDGRRHGAMVRRHLHSCESCRAFRAGLRADARVLRALAPGPAGGLAGGGAIAGLAAKGAVGGGAVGGGVVGGGALSQFGAACAVTVCSVGGVALLSHHLPAIHDHGHAATAHAVRHVDRAARRPSSPLTPPAIVATQRATGRDTEGVTTLHNAATAGVVRGPAAGVSRRSGSETDGGAQRGEDGSLGGAGNVGERGDDGAGGSGATRDDGGASGSSGQTRSVGGSGGSGGSGSSSGSGGSGGSGGPGATDGSGSSAGSGGSDGSGGTDDSGGPGGPGGGITTATTAAAGSGDRSGLDPGAAQTGSGD